MSIAGRKNDYRRCYDVKIRERKRRPRRWSYLSCILLDYCKRKKKTTKGRAQEKNSYPSEISR